MPGRRWSGRGARSRAGGGRATPTWLEGTTTVTGASGSAPLAATISARSASAASLPYRTHRVSTAMASDGTQPPPTALRLTIRQGAGPAARVRDFCHTPSLGFSACRSSSPWWPTSTSMSRSPGRGPRSGAAGGPTCATRSPTSWRSASTARSTRCLVAGDLYEHDRFSPDTVRFVETTFAKLDPLPVLVAPGNHDWLAPAGLYRQARFGPNVHLFTTDRLEPVTLVDGCTLWGAAHLRPRGTDGFLDRFRVDRSRAAPRPVPRLRGRRLRAPGRRQAPARPVPRRAGGRGRSRLRLRRPLPPPHPERPPRLPGIPAAPVVRGVGGRPPARRRRRRRHRSSSSGSTWPRPTSTTCRST